MPAPTTQFFTGQMPFLPPNQQCQSTEDIEHWSLRVSHRILFSEAIFPTPCLGTTPPLQLSLVMPLEYSQLNEAKDMV